MQHNAIHNTFLAGNKCKIMNESDNEGFIISEGTSSSNNMKKKETNHDD